MSISLDKLIKVNSGVINAATRATTISNMLMTKNTLVPINTTQRALPFTSSDQVSNYFGIDSNEYLYSTFYFKGYDGQLGMAKLLWIGRWVDGDQAAYIRGNSINPTTTLTALKAITAGAITFTFNSTTQALTNLDFSTATSLSGCALIIQIALAASLSGATVVYSALTQSFIATAPVGTGTSTVGFCPAGTLSTLIKMTTATLAVLSQGAVDQTPAQNWQAVKNITRNWGTGSKLWEVEASPFAESLADCEWFNGQNGAYAYAPYSSTLATVLAFKAAVVDATYANIFVNYSLYDLPAGELGALAAVNYRQTNAVISLTNKSFSGVTPLVTDDDTYDLLVAAKINFYGRFQSRNDEFNFAEEGWLTGQWLYIENLVNNIWVVDQIQIKLAGFLKTSKITPYNSTGYTSLQTVLIGVGELAKVNGVATVGNVFSEAIIQKLQADVGFDLAATLTSQGYYAVITPADYDQRVNREPVDGSFYYTNSGNIGKITINNNLVV